MVESQVAVMISFSIVQCPVVEFGSIDAATAGAGKGARQNVDHERQTKSFVSGGAAQWQQGTRRIVKILRIGARPSLGINDPALRDRLALLIVLANFTFRRDTGRNV